MYIPRRLRFKTQYDKQKLIAKLLFFLTGAVIIGFILSGPALRLFGSHNIFLVISSLLFLSAFFVRVIPGESSRAILLLALNRIFSKGFVNRASMPWRYKRKINIFISELIAGYRFISSQNKVRSMIFLLVSSQAVIAILMALAPGFADKILNIDIAQISVFMLAPAAIGVIFGVLWIGHFGRRFQGEKMIDIGILAVGIFLLSLSLLSRTHSLLILILLLFGVGLANAFIDVPANTFLQINTSDKIRGRVYGVLSSLIAGVAFIPVVIAGGLADVFGVIRVIAVLSILFIIYGIVRIFRNDEFLPRR